MAHLMGHVLSLGGALRHRHSTSDNDENEEGKGEGQGGIAEGLNLQRLITADNGSDSEGDGVFNANNDEAEEEAGDLPPLPLPETEGGGYRLRHLLALAKRGQFHAAADVVAAAAAAAAAGAAGTALPGQLESASRPQQWALQRDRRWSRTAAHYAGISPQGELLLRQITLTAGSRSLLKARDCKGATPLHYAAARHTAEALADLLKVDGVKPKYLALTDKAGNTVAHFAASNTIQKDTVLIVVEAVGPQCLAWQNASGQTVLQLAMQTSCLAVARDLLDKAGSKCAALRDEDGNTWAHYAAKKANNEDIVLALLDRQDVLILQNHFNESVLHFALRVCSAEVSKRLVNTAGSSILSLRDIDGNTCAHYAAMRDNNDDVIAEVVKVAGPMCLRMRNVRGEIVWHFVFKNARFATVMKFIELWQSNGLEIPNQADADGNRIPHYAVMKVDCDDKLNALVELKKSRCLHWQNKKGQTAVHLAMQQCSQDLAVQLVRRAKSAIVELRDDEGNTCLHYAAESQKFDVIEAAVGRQFDSDCWLWKNKRDQTVMHLAVRQADFAEVPATGQTVGIVDAAGRNMLFYACIGWNCNGLIRCGEASQRKEFQRLDVDKNTLAHAAFLNDRAAQDSEKFFQTLSRVLDAGVETAAENNLGQTCLQTSVIDADIFLDILRTAADDKKWKPRFGLLLFNSSGVHAVHAFAGRYSLQDMAEPLAQLSDLPVLEMLQLEVAKGPSKGATCLHFACEAGHEENMQYLMRSGLRLSTKTQEGLSCIDFGYDKGKLATIAGLPRIQRISLLQLVDPVQRSLKLPDRFTARHLLASISDESMRVSIQREANTIMRTTVTAGDGGDKTEKELLSRTDLKILLRAVQLDSPKILRSGLRLDLISQKTEKYLKTLLYEKQKLGRLKDFATFSESELQAFIKSGQMIDDETSEMLIMDFCLHFEKIEILPDLLLTRQFQLIPACVRLLIQLKPKIARKKGRHEQLKRLHSEVVCIAVNALDELFVNANQKEKELLFKYIRGDIKSGEESSPGPRFPCKSLDFSACGCSSKAKRCNSCPEDPSSSCEVNRYHTVFQLIREADDDDLFATDCMYELVKQDWEGRRKSEVAVDISSPRTNFYIQLFGFGFFLAYFAWYLVDFRNTLANPAADIVLFLYMISFTTQEVNDFLRSQHRRRYQSRRSGMTCTCPEYFQEMVNYFDLAALLFMWLGMIWKFTIFGNSTAPHPTAYVCQMVLSTSFLLWGFRSVSFLSYSDHIGPVITMLGHLLLRDLLPFLAIVFIILYSFGIFFFNLLFTATTASAGETAAPGYGLNAFVQVYNMPLMLLFSDFPQDLRAAASADSQSVDSQAANPTGYRLFENLARYGFLLMCNLVMLNLLIALFNLRVSTLSSKARGIWRRAYFRMLLEYRSVGPVPPPVSFLYYAYRLALRCQKCRQRRVVSTDLEPKKWWLKEPDYPAEYGQFLQFQASHFRRARSSLFRRLEGNRSDPEGLKSHTRNALAELQAELDDSLARQAARLTRLEDRAAEESLAGQGDRASAKRRSARLKGRVKALEAKLDEVLRLLWRQEQ